MDIYFGHQTKHKHKAYKNAEKHPTKCDKLSCVEDNVTMTTRRKKHQHQRSRVQKKDKIPHRRKTRADRLDGEHQLTSEL